MRILIEGENLDNYLAKCHEAFRTGLRAMFEVRSFGKGYHGYWPRGPFVRTYGQIMRKLFPDVAPDLLIAEFDYRNQARRFPYAGLAEIDVPKAIYIGDYWDIADNYRDEFVQIVMEHGVKFVFSYFPQPLKIWANSEIADRLTYLPPCFDPRVFNDWKLPKAYAVGFLAAGTLDFTDFYPERHAIHKKLLKKKDLRYLWAPHPGEGRHAQNAPLVGRSFSQAINSCRMFITTGGRHRNAHAKYVEILASRSLLLADEPVGFERLQLQDGYNYVRISEDDVIDKMEHFLSRPDKADEIAEHGYRTALRYHTCYVRALEFYDVVTSFRASTRTHTVQAPIGCSPSNTNT